MTDMGMYSLDLMFWLNVIVLIVIFGLIYLFNSRMIPLFTVKKEEYNMYYTIVTVITCADDCCSFVYIYTAVFRNIHKMVDCCYSCYLSLCNVGSI